jgi:DOPA 4,5-dioxygenase
MSLQRHPHVASAVNPEIIQHYHAHVYYDPASSRDRAARLRERVAAIFPDVTLGRWHDAPVGPHTQSMYQLAFPPPLLASFLPWLMLNRDGLSILLHPGTGDAYADHIDHAVWFGQRAAAAGGRSAKIARDAVTVLKDLRCLTK